MNEQVRSYWSSSLPKTITDEKCETCDGSGVAPNRVDYSEMEAKFAGMLPPNEDGEPRCRDCGGVGRSYTFGLDPDFKPTSI